METCIWISSNSRHSIKGNFGTPVRVWASATLSRHLSDVDKLSVNLLTDQDKKNRQNPFEMELDRWRLPIISPSDFLQAPTEQKNEQFRWSIDELALLKPADIEEISTFTDSPQQDEQHVQEAINLFFSQKQVVPSPWLSVKKSSNDVSRNRKQQDAACQTMLSLPVDFPLDQLLGDYYNCRKEDSPDVLNASSLRRKLFFQGDIGSSPSPVKSEKTWLNCMQCDESPCKTSPLMLFSSSPVGNIKLCRSSVSPVNALSSPQLSPITIQKYQTVNDDQANQCLLMLGTCRLALSEIPENSALDLTSMESQDTGYQTGSLQIPEEVQRTDKLISSQTGIYLHTPPKLLLSKTPQKKKKEMKFFNR